MSWHENASCIIGPPLTKGFPHRGAILQSFNVFFVVRLNKASIEENKSYILQALYEGNPPVTGGFP